METALKAVEITPPVPDLYKGPQQREDPLLGCLVILSRIFGNPKSDVALAAGLPMGETGLTPELFIRAADRAGLTASLMRRPIGKINPLALPCVLLLSDRQACVLLRLRGPKAQIATPDNLDGSQEVALSDLESRYTGSLLIARPKIRLDSRSSEYSEAESRSWFWGSVFRYTPIYLEVVLAALLVNIFAIISPLFVMTVYDRVVPNRAFETLWVLAIGVAAGFTFDFMLRTLRGYFLDRTGKELDRRISARIFEHIMSVRMASGPQSAGAFASNVREFETLRDFFTSASLAAVVDVPFLFLFILVIWFVGGPLAVVPMVLVPLVLIVSLLIQVPMRRAVGRSYKESAQKHATLVEAINGLNSIKVASAEGQMQRDWDSYVAASASSSMSSRQWSTLSVNFTLFCSNLATVAVVVWGVFRTADGDMTVGAMVAVSMLTARAMAPLGQISSLAVRFYQSWASLQGLNKLMALPSERPHGKVFLRRPTVEGAIEFREVNFRYPGQQTAALSGVSFKIAPGEKVGIVGRIGSGKTTVERLIMGLFDPDEGAVLIDGTDIRQVDPADLRRSIGCVLQDAHLFYGTVKTNITLGAPYVDETSVIRAAVVSGVDSFVRTHPLGYDLPVGEGGRMLSGGQRQAISLARALLMDPPILMLDEPTSSMDNSTEGAFKARVGDIVRDRTLVLITHRNSMLSLVDRLIVLDNGKIVADGPKAVVLDALAKGRVRSGDV